MARVFRASRKALIAPELPVFDVDLQGAPLAEASAGTGKSSTVMRLLGWTIVTKDHSLSAQWEHMVAVTEDGYDVLTVWPDGPGGYPAV